MLTQTEKKELLRLARQTIEIFIKKQAVTDYSTELSGLLEPRGAFVTLHKDGTLRGCIGIFESADPLYKTVQKMAIAAATEDPRFSKVLESELSSITLDISALTPRKGIENLDEIQVGVHGLYVSKGWNRGVLLPQVATEENWDRDTFLSHTCMKAGLPQDEWKKGELKIEIFSAEVFGE